MDASIINLGVESRHMNMRKAYRAALARLEKIRRNRKVVAAYLFGSYLKNPKKARDIDICIVGKLDRDEMARIALEFDKPVDLSFMELMPYYVAARVLREGRQLFVNDSGKMAEAWAGVVRNQLEYGAMRQRIYEGVLSWMSSTTAQTG